MTVRTYSGYAAIGLIVDFIAEREHHRIQQRVNQIASQNYAAINQQGDGFLFKGLFYQDTNASTRYTEKHVLSPKLWGEMEAVQLDKQLVHSETQKTSQGLLLLLKACQSWQDARDALPEFLVPALKLEPRLERTRPEAWTIQNNPAKMAAYQSIRDTLEVRVASRLIY